MNLTVSSDPIKEGDNSYATVTATLDKVSEKTVSVYLKGSGVDVTDFRLSDDTTSISSGGLFAHYTFDGNANDITGNGNNSVDVQATLIDDRFGNAQSAYGFNGSSNYIEFEFDDSNQDVLRDQLTMSLWVRRDGTGTGTPRIISNQDSRFFIFDVASGIEARHIQQQSSYFGAGGPGDSYHDGNWFHLVVTSKRNTSGNKDGEMKFFIDGVLASNYSNSDNSSDFNLIDVLWIGNWGGNNGGDYFKGAVDDVRIYNKYLSDSEVETLYQKESATSDPNVISISAGSTSGLSLIHISEPTRPY